MTLPAKGGQITKERGLFSVNLRFLFANRRPPAERGLKEIRQAQMAHHQGILSLSGMECPEATFQLRI
jgi:hypothetical protein